MSRIVEGSILTILFFLVVNVVFLNVYFIANSSRESAAATTAIEHYNNVICDDECRNEISSSILATITPMTKSVADEDTFVIKSDLQHEFIIPLGSGSTFSKEYESIPGVEVFIDTSLYEGIKEVIFETYMSIPTANGFAFVKLFNVTDKHDVWYSEQSMETDKIVMRESKIILDKGKKLYKVMMKSTMGYEAKIHNARIRIITK